MCLKIESDTGWCSILIGSTVRASPEPKNICLIYTLHDIRLVHEDSVRLQKYKTFG